MLEATLVREAMHEGFDSVVDLGDGILRGERRFKDQPFLVAYIDLADDVVARSENLITFQEKLLGSAFFSSESDLRWNSYLYFLAGPKSKALPGYLKAKALIESDRHFARKFVLSELDLSVRLRPSPTAKASPTVMQMDAGTTWSELLRAGQLGVLLEQRPRTKALELIAAGEAFQSEAKSVARAGAAQHDPLQLGLLRSMTVDHFRLINNGKKFQFGDVNLIFGPNGTGKTSLLEAIEALYCGRVRRDPDATFAGLKAEIELPTGKRVSVAETTTPADLKARNLSWYGRPDPQSSAISQGFTRFNFLDTDAAFRLSSDLDPAEIKQDIGKLLVGAETSKLWTYLSKLEVELRDKIKVLNDRLPALRSQIELLAADVRRLRDTPSAASALAKSYSATLVDLGAKWPTDADRSVLNPKDRSRLEALSRSIGVVVSSLRTTPVTIPALRERAKIVEGALGDVRRLAGEHDKSIERLNVVSGVIHGRQQTIEVLEQWHKYCESGVPALASSLQRAQLRIAPLRAALSGISAETLAELPMAYSAEPIEEAVANVRMNLETASREEQSATQALLQQHQLGQSLVALRRDLHDAALAVVKKEGNESACPVCGTLHGPSELLTKIESLIAEQAASYSDGLLKRVRLAKERLEQEREVNDLLIILQSYHRNRGLPEVISCGALRTELLGKRAELNELLHETEQLTAATVALERTTGLKWANYELTHDAAKRFLPADADPADARAVAQALISLRGAQTTDTATADDHRRETISLVSKISDALHAIGLSLPMNSGPSSAVTLVERESQQVEDALVSASTVGEQITIVDGQSFELLQRLADQTLAAFDKASHAALGQDQAQNQLRTKTVELEKARADLAADEKMKKNYDQAKTVLSPLVTNHSLEKATKEVLSSIKDQVSDIFSRIHSPQEYKLGDFEDGQMLVSREGNQERGVNQISTGQRAAFAMSIFMALNRSAASAPPVVLIDDPVAHIDDLNALSFLDYLRDLVMSSRKQVFFATADARLAALFQRKFGFLGGERFKKILLGS